MKRFAPLALIALLGACETLDGGTGREPAGPGPFPNGPPGQPDQANGAPYRAIGTEPFWSLDIDPREMRFSQANDSRDIVEPTPRVIHGFAGEIYQGQRIRVNIVHGQCSDGMSDRVYPDTVQVGVDGKAFRGCGGTPVLADLSSDLVGRWTATGINGRPAVAAGRFTLIMTPTSLQTVGICNDVRGNYAIVAGRLTPDGPPWPRTERGCDPARMAIEDSVYGVLWHKPAISFPRADQLRLTGANGTIDLERQ